MKIIWNITNRCAYQCEFCGTASLEGESKSAKIEGSICGLQLSEKYNIVEELNNINVESIDFSGGDPMLDYDNLKTISKARIIFGKSKIHVTTTGHGLKGVSDNFIIENIGQLDFTFDYPLKASHPQRPNNYNSLNFSQALRVRRLGVSICAQIPIVEANIQKIGEIITDLKRIQVSKVKLLRYIPVGRISSDFMFWKEKCDEILTEIDCIVNKFKKELPIEVHCAMRHDLLGDKHWCNMLHDKIGIDSRGNVFACAWTGYLELSLEDNPFYLGNILKQNIHSILNSERAINIKKSMPSKCRLFDSIDKK